MVAFIQPGPRGPTWHEKKDEWIFASNSKGDPIECSQGFSPDGLYIANCNFTNFLIKYLNLISHILMWEEASSKRNQVIKTKTNRLSFTSARQLVDVHVILLENTNVNYQSRPKISATVTFQSTVVGQLSFIVQASQPKYLRPYQVDDSLI